MGRYGPESFDFSAERVTASVRESLARLQLSHVDLVQCHDIEFGNLDQVRAAGRGRRGGRLGQASADAPRPARPAARAPQIVNETLPALNALKGQGLLRFVGITGLPLRALTYVLDRAPPGERGSQPRRGAAPSRLRARRGRAGRQRR